MYMQVANSQFLRNAYGAGFRIRGGAADVDMKDTVMSENADSGLNITYSGGRRILERVRTTNNYGMGKLQQSPLSRICIQ